jgi:transcription antitermination protein NusB
VTGTGGRASTARAKRSASGRGATDAQAAVRHRPTQRIETRARARALQALYAWDVRATVSGPQPRPKSRTQAEPTARLVRVADDVWNDLAVAPTERQIARKLIDGVADNLAELDRELERVVTNWRLGRMAVVDRCVLRLAAAELTQGTTPARVVIKEAVRLAERYGANQSAQFVNGILDALARRMDRL